MGDAWGRWWGRFPHPASRLPTALPRGLLGSPGDRQTSRCRRGSATLLQPRRDRAGIAHTRSEEHTSELQSLAYLVCRLLLEKKKKTIITKKSHTHQAHAH